MVLKEFKAKYEHKPVQEQPNQVPDKPVVSVCVQTYNHVSYIRECLDGILMQETDFPIEILLGEDQSTDGTREICLEYAEKHPDKIRLFLHHRENNIKINGNPTGRFNFINNLYSAKGKYIALCEGDDYWTDPLKLQKQVDFLEKNQEYVITYHNASVIKDGIEIKSSKLKEQRKRDYSKLELQKAFLVLTLTMCFRNIIKDFPDEMFQILNADTFLVSLLGSYGKGKYLGSIKPACYRVHEGGIWSSIDKEAYFNGRIGTCTGFKEYYTRVGNTNLKNCYNSRLRNAHLSFMKYLLGKRDFKNSMYHLKKGYKYSDEKNIIVYWILLKSWVKGVIFG